MTANDTSYPMPIWTVTFNASDYPDQYAARLFHVYAGTVEATSTIIVSDYYATIENQMLERGLYKLGRNNDDEPHIVETWV